MEFQEVMRQWRRFCKSHNHCGECEFDGKGICGETHSTEVPFEKIERVIMSWAEEHPEPVYPTWGDWLAEIGLISWQNNGDGVYSVMVPTFKMCEHIPADIAERLGIEPKEGI